MSVKHTVSIRMVLRVRVSVQKSTCMHMFVSTHGLCARCAVWHGNIFEFRMYDVHICVLLAIQR